MIGGLSQDVATYMVSAFFLGVFFAMQSGTFESIVYDSVLEEMGTSDAFERTIGRVRLVGSVGLVASALAGGVIAEVAPLRITYFLTAPLLAVTTFTAGQQQTLPIWIFSRLFRPRQRPVTNVAALLTIAITFVPILVAQLLSRDALTPTSRAQPR